MPAAGTHFATAWSVHFTLVGPLHSESLRRLAGRAMLNMPARI